MKKFLTALMFLALTSQAFADIGCKVNGDSTKCGPFTNIDFKAQTGSDISTITGMTRAIPVVGSTMFATGVANGGATSMASTTNAIPVGFDFVRMTIPLVADPLYAAKTIANGVPGQILTLYVSQVGPLSSTASGGSATITPTTSTGFASIKLSAVKDIVVLHYVDSVVGWVILSYDNGAASSITITQSAS